jgi:hypothetical protein
MEIYLQNAAMNGRFLIFAIKDDRTPLFKVRPRTDAS